MRKLKHIILLFVLLSIPMGYAVAQDTGVKTDATTGWYSNVGFVNSNDMLSTMPEYIKASAKVAELNKKYKEELQIMQNDYNKKYSDFMSSQNTLAENIRIRRMQELYELERHINDFMEIAQKDIETYEQETITPLRKKLKDAISDVGVELDLVSIYDLANPTILFVTPSGTDITKSVKKKLGIK